MLSPVLWGEEQNHLGAKEPPIGGPEDLQAPLNGSTFQSSLLSFAYELQILRRIHSFLLLVLFLTLPEEEAGAETEVGQLKVLGRSQVEDQSILQLWGRQNALNNYSKCKRSHICRNSISCSSMTQLLRPEN